MAPPSGAQGYEPHPTAVVFFCSCKSSCCCNYSNIALHTQGKVARLYSCFSFHTCIPYRGVLACVVEQYGRPSRVLGEPLRHIVDFPVQNDPAVLELFVLSNFLAREARKLRRRRDHLRARRATCGIAKELSNAKR